MFGTRERPTDDRESAEPISPEATALAASKEHMWAVEREAALLDKLKGVSQTGGGDTSGAVLAAGGKRSPLLPEAVVRGIAYGTVNGILLPPVLVSFATIIFRDPAFTAHLPTLMKLVMVSGSVHMACFGVLSSLKFAVGSVQDAGLIFLSAIASSVVAFSAEEGLDEAGMLSTTCFILCTCTSVLGVALVVLGRLRLAGVVQYIPMPVIGGYLAFIGYFCGQAGLAFATGLNINSIRDLGLLANSEAFGLVLPSVVGGVFMYLCVRRFPSAATLPLLMVGVLATFFGFLWITGTTLEESRSKGWVSEASPMLSLTRAWNFFSLADVRWDVFPRVVPNLLAMIVVVAFSSCLDIVAIEMEMGRPLDFNGELQTVGWSNVISGLSGGFTGSYIFSQTIFNLRAGVDTRAASATSFVMILALAASPVSVISFLPRCFFGSLLVLISVDLMLEWLWQARARMTPAEYAVCLATFVMIQLWNVEKGMLAGLVLATLSFTITYAQAPTVMTARVKASTVMRTFEERMILKAHQEETVVLELQGFIFFGSAVKILSDVKDRIVWGTDQPNACEAGDSNSIFSNVNDEGACAGAKVSQQQLQPNHLEGVGVANTISPVSNRSGAIHRRSSSSPPIRPMGVPADPPFFRLPKSLQSRSKTWMEPPSESFSRQQIQQQEVESGSRKVSPGNTQTVVSDGSLYRGPSGDVSSTAPLTVGAVSKNESSRPFSTSSVEQMLPHEEEHIPLVGTNDASTSTGMPGESDTGTGGSVEGQRTYGAMEEGVAGGGGGDGAVPPRKRMHRMRGASVGEDVKGGGGATVAGDGAVQAYMSLWANGGVVIDSRGDRDPGSSWSPSLSGRKGGSTQSFKGNFGGIVASPEISGRVGRSASVASLLPTSKRRTRRVVLDFSHVVGIDATAAQSCFLMLKIVLRTSGTDVVFSGANRTVDALLRSHGVITENDAVFNSLDSALEWAEEMMLKERRDDMIMRRAGGRAILETAASGLAKACHPSRQQSVGGSAPPGLDPRSTSGVFGSKGDGGASSLTGQTRAVDGEEKSYKDCSNGGDVKGSTKELEAAVFSGDHEDYYFRAETLRRRSSLHSWIEDQEDNPLVVGDVGSLQSILEDYLEVDRYQAPEGVRSMLREAHAFFRRESVEAGAVLEDNNGAHGAEKLYFIGAGSVDVQIPGDCGPRRLQKICAGGIFGEVGFFLRSPQAFRAVAREPCHLHTLDRAGMVAMQRQNPGLCILVQKAAMKSICLAASLSIEAAYFAPVDDDRLGRLGRIEEER